MSLVSKLQPDSATNVGVITAVGVYLIYQNALPSATDIRQANPHDSDVETTRKHAAWKSAALIGAVFLVARDLNSFIISGVALVGVDLMIKHANAVHPQTGKLDVSSTDTSIMPGNAGAYPLPSDYDTEAA